MLSTHSGRRDPADIEVGNRCMLSVSGRQFLAEILEVAEDTLRVSTPYQNFPLGGMRVNLEFHDTHGYTQYSTVVVTGPTTINDGIVLSRPSAPRRNQHRSSLRVPTDLTAQVKDQIHVRRYNADVLDIGYGGALICSQAPFNFETTIEISISLPGEALYTFVGQVVHMNEVDDELDTGTRHFGVRFITNDPQPAQAVARYIQRRLEELHSEG